jgi:phosphate starvation-inducible PhoH-like protein
MSFRCYVNLPADVEIFFLRRKARLVKARSKYKPKRYVSRVERLHEEEMQCISVDHKDSLYLTDNYTVTHNTHLACAFAISEILAKRKKKCVLTRPIVEAGEALGFLPGTFDEKVGPYMMPMYDCIQKCVGIGGPQKDIIDRSIEVAPIAYMRGRTIDNAVCIFDEAQNATKAQLKLFMTRFGENSKIIITGDPYQSDLRRDDQGLMHVVKRLEDLPGVGVIYFKASSIVRHPLIAAILEKLEKEPEKE